MPFRFRKHYTLEQARALLPRIREWLGEIQQLRRRLRHNDERMTHLAAGGADIGGEMVNAHLRLIARMQEVLREFAGRQIQIKDLDRGLIDFPAIIGGKEVFLCWEQDENDIEFWHDLDSGYAGREKL